MICNVPAVQGRDAEVVFAQPLTTLRTDLKVMVLQVPRKCHQFGVEILNEGVKSCSSWTTELFNQLNYGLKSCLEGCFLLTKTHFFVQVNF